MTSFGSNGRLANQLFQYASSIGIAYRLQTGLVLPAWKYAEYFEAKFPEQEHSLPPEIRQVSERGFNYDDFYPDYSDIKGYLQSVKYWQSSESKVIESLTFKQKFKDKVKQGYDFTKPVIAIHIRRGDYVGHPCYYQLPITYFYNALEQWADWRDCNVLIFSDDIPYCKLHFDCLDNVQYATGNEIEDLCLMRQCNRFILSNSSYSWWGAYLSDSKEVIRPDCLFDGDYKLTHDDKDFWIEDWKVLSPEQKIDLTDVTFTIPVFYDHPDRSQNLRLCVFMLQKFFDTNIIVMENKTSQFEDLPVEYYQSWHTYFHRTKMLNDMMRLSKTNIIFNWDADVIVSPIQILQAVIKLRLGIDIVFPYDGRFARMERLDWFAKIKQFKDIGIVAGQYFKGLQSGAKTSFGGAVGYLKDRYVTIGGENEKFISFGAEDLERVERAKKLGLTIERVKGILFHISHWCGNNSTTANPFFWENRAEFEKVEKMSKEELIKYVESWE